MIAAGFAFERLDSDPHTAARCSRLHTPRGSVELPAFMPVGTQATVKGMTIDLLRATGAQMILGNTYHLALRPGETLIGQLGGLHRFMGWDGPILTDSGGFQVFSLAAQTQVTDQGALFRSHIDGRPMLLTPERAVAIQQTLGSDLAMVLDHVVALPSPLEQVREACERTILWARRSREVPPADGQALLAIVQGGLDIPLRRQCAQELVAMPFDGYAIGGLSVGEPPEQMYAILDEVCRLLPDDRPRYLMGVGRPQDLLEGIARGVDLFDCVMPTRNGRNAQAFTDSGPLRLRNQRYQADPRPLEDHCPCPACRHSRAYLRHLFQAREMLGPMLLTAHNLTYYQRLMADARQAIAEHRFREFQNAKRAGWGAADGSQPAE